MNIHEHQAKELFKAYGISVPEGRAAGNVDEAVQREVGGLTGGLKIPGLF